MPGIRGVMPAHIARRKAALTQGASIRPAGSVNLTRLEVSKGIPDRQIAARDRRLRQALDGLEVVCLDDYRLKVAEGSAPRGKPVLATEDVPGSVRYVEILSVEPEDVKAHGGEGRSVYIQTVHGEMLLPSTTFVVLT